MGKIKNSFIFILGALFFLVIGMAFYFKENPDQKPNWIKNIRERTLSNGEMIRNIQKVQEEQMLNQNNNEGNNEYQYPANITIKGKLNYENNYDYSYRESTLASPENKITFNYILERSSKPDFDIIEGGTFNNSGNTIIFPLKPLKIKVKKGTYINDRYYSSGSIFEIKSVELLPRFHNIEYSFGKGNDEIKYSISTDEIKYSISTEEINEEINEEISKEKEKKEKEGVKNIKINFKANLNTSGKFIFKKYHRGDEKTGTPKLIGIIDKALLDFDTRYSELKGKEYNKKELPLFLNSSKDKQFFDFTKNISSKWEQGNFIINYKALPKDIDFILFFDDEEKNLNNEENKVNYSLQFRTIGDFKLTLSKNRYTKTNTLNNYHICVNQPIDEKKTRKNFEQAFGTGNITISFSENTKVFTHQEKGNSCMMFYYYTNPEKVMKFSTKIFGIYENAQTEASIVINPYTIAKKFKEKKLIGNAYNILPLNGEWGNKIQVASRNYASFPIYTQNCKWNLDGAMRNIQQEIENNKSHYRSRIYINPFDNIIQCDKTKTHQFKKQDFKYWKSFVSDFSLNNKGITNNLFKASLYTGSRNDKIFLKTNLGIFAKINREYRSRENTTNDNNINKLYLWVNNLDDGNPSQKVKVDFYGLADNEEKLIHINGNTINGETILNLPKKIKAGYIKAQKGNDIAISFLSISYNLNINNNSINFEKEDMISSYDIGFENAWGEYSKNISVYAYSDRVLYKPGDKIFVSGWVRDLSKKNAKVKGTVSIQLEGNNGGEITSINKLSLDEFGGFVGELQLGKDSKLGNYELVATWESPDGKMHREHRSYLKVEEYKKNTFFITTKKINNKEGKRFLDIRPQYYFGQNLEKWNIEVNQNFHGNEWGKADRFWCNENKNEEQWCDYPYYYNAIRGNDENKSFNYKLKNYHFTNVDIPLDSIQNTLFGTMNYTINIVDQASKEVVSKYSNESYSPKYAIGLEGRRRDYQYQKGNLMKIKGNILEKVSENEKNEKNEKNNLNKLNNDFFKKVKRGTIEIKIYQKDFKSHEEKGPDGEWYYVWGDDYKLIKTATTKIDNGTFNYEFTPEKGGDYFVRALYESNEVKKEGKEDKKDDKKDEVKEVKKEMLTYEVQKNIYIYDNANNFSYGWWGKKNNNIKLDVNIKEKKYLPNDTIEVNINPYIKGATAIITVEQGNSIKKKITKKLDGTPITLKVEEDWYPNAFVSVALMIGEKINNKINEHRKEPRFLLGYSEITLDPSLMDLHYTIKITDEKGKELSYYQPGEKVKITIETKNSQGKGVKTRLSVGIIDKALLDIYDKLREPLSYFYNRFGNSIINFANWQHLYKALKVFSADGSKGGGGGDGAGEMFPMRKEFHDVAFWTGALITNDKGIAHFTTQIPDNLTTWIVDIIGISQQNRMGTKREKFIVSKDVILQPNLPKFITLEDKIQIPYKLLINNTNLKKDEIKVSGTVKFGKTNIPLAIDNKKETANLDLGKLSEKEYQMILKSSYILVQLIATDKTGGKSNKTYDAVEKKLPLRKDGFLISEFAFAMTKKFQKSFQIAENTRFTKVNIQVGKVPVSAFEKALEYLIHYPYGCTEQIMSGLYPILSAVQLQKHNLISNTIIRKEKEKLLISINNEYKSIPGIIETAIQKIKTHQKNDGGMGYWEDQDEKSDSYLSVYVYGAILDLQKNGYHIDKDFLQKLENYIKGNKDTNILLYYYFQRARNQKKIDSFFIKELLSKEDITTNIITKILAYTTLKTANNSYENGELKNEIKQFFLSKKNIQKGDTGNIQRDGSFFNRNILLAYFARVLPASEAQPYILELLQKRDEKGIWSYSTQENVQILLTLGEYIQKTKTNEAIPYTIKIADQEIKGVLANNEQNKNIEVLLEEKETKKTIEIQTESSKSLLYDVHIQYLPKNLENIQGQKNNVEFFDLMSINKKDLQEKIDNAEIGEEIELVGRFKTQEDAKKVAIAFYIPANISLINPALIKQNNRYNYDYYYYSPENNTISFKTLDKKEKHRYSCWPNHMEVRFDRLFLYYGKLNKGEGCEVKFKAIKTHEGKFHIMPASLFEMYNTNVWANSIVK